MAGKRVVVLGDLLIDMTVYMKAGTTADRSAEAKAEY